MTNDQMREAWLKSGIRATAVNYTVFRAAWYAAHTIGFAAGMEQAEKVCRVHAECCRQAESPVGAWHAEACADAIRAEIPHVVQE
ncbi:hypothetical protein [Cupriavidus gilardii]|uniref:Uncharacterized protein n=1 Tax=Cupriavidus gilardii TaxID=82541 RepID=A0A849BHL9_9BURK|nr:hypothetical protein [Cupriavidus gilardii]KAB0597776.1 hypothetical protein F7Q96_07600 [Cupriavidus gilardii]NNH12067.1 hypothetical protein [Cupriavidus gilardii]WNG69300.1 hypothetical protein QWJ31_19565 [Cupriavidus gilardii]WNG71733.1 hypothetical protein QWJ31_16615 [Cupriavidus gilardii]